MILFLSAASLLLALMPAVMFFLNLPLFQLQQSDRDEATTVVSVSVLIPARNEAEGIAACVRSVVASQDVSVEVVVLDDHSTDATRKIVNEIAAQDDRLRCIAGEELPEGWNGKQFACTQLAQAAEHQHIVFLDADVRLSPNALSVLVVEKRNRSAALLSQFPRQITGSIAEHALIPMMHFILLGYLPFARMRSSSHPAYAAGCGQFFLTTQSEYQAAGTHAAIRGSRHDGIQLPKIFRAAGMITDVVDGTNLAQCRMYNGASKVINGVLKNATEGIAHPTRIIPFTILLLGSCVLPWITLAWSVAQHQPLGILLSAPAILFAHVPRVLAAIHFRQSWLGVVTHSIGILVFVTLQWIALILQLLGKQVSWRGRK